MVVALTRLYHVQRVKRASTRVKSTYEASYTVAWHAREEAKRSENFRILLPYLSLSLFHAARGGNFNIRGGEDFAKHFPRKTCAAGGEGNLEV